MYLHKDSTIIVADIAANQLTDEVRNFLNGNIVFRDCVLKEHMIGCTEFEEAHGYDDLSDQAKDCLEVIQTEASKLCAAYIRLVA